MTVRIVDSIAALPAELDALGARRVLVITTPSRRFVDRLNLGDRIAGVFDRAAVHVPRAIVDEATAVLRELRPDTLLTVGGGAATGLGKALRMRADVKLVALPTTWSGSEMTRIFGITDAGAKETGRDDRARPDLVVHDPALLATLPRKVSVTSLLNALAHPMSALTTGSLDAALEQQSIDAIRDLAWALDQLLVDPASRDGIAIALRGVRLGAGVLDQAPMGEHHTTAHLLGGALGVDHAALHAILLPHTAHRLMSRSAERAAALAAATGSPDAPAHLYDVLIRVGAPRSLLALAGEEAARLTSLVAEHGLLRAPWVADAMVGRRPSLRARRSTFGGDDVTWIGPELDQATRVVVALHGRGADAGSVARVVNDLAGHAADVAIVAPQAASGAWYPLPYRRPLAEHGDAIPEAITRVERILEAVVAKAGAKHTWLFGFSQGACLAAEVFARTAHPLAGLVAPAGARVGTAADASRIARRLDDTPVLLGASRDDPWVTPADVDRTADGFRDHGATVHRIDGAGDTHHISALQRLVARELLGTRPKEAALRGFGNTFESEALPGALPRHQNTPRPAPYGLHGEHVSGTGFTATRADHRKLWLYRIRPSSGGASYRPLAHPTFVADWDGCDPNLAGWGPIAVPPAPADFVDGLATLGGAGAPGIRRGYAVHLYAADRSMNDRAFSNADGDLLLVPWDGRLTLLTEAGVLEVEPGTIAILPRGVRFSVLLRDGVARGWVAEVYGRHFELPERGAVGANGLADARHFQAPHAWFEDRLSPGYRVTVKHGGALHETTQDHSPYDVVAWYGNHVPLRYDLMDFSPVTNARFDHIDPSVHTVVHAGLDEPGVSALDFVFFAPRWDVSEHTFRPPYFHRNAVTEINGIIADPTLDPNGPFAVGCTFLTPGMTPHGVRAPGAERALAGNDEPSRIHEGSRWFQFESALPLHLTSWAKKSRIPDWTSRWGSYRSHFVRA
jgi:homogentisate 1,2-dioxygenase